MRKVSTTIQLPQDVMEALNRYKAESGVSKNVIIERCLRALFEGRIIDLPEDLMEKLRRVEEEFGSPPSFVIDRALRLFFDRNIRIYPKKSQAQRELQEKQEHI
jgi:predicted transcriptional regulator